jgi:DnaJ-class molecular chaperone
MTDPRFIECSGCNGDGESKYGLCRYCAGSGVEEIEVEPITLEDLEEQCPAR